METSTWNKEKEEILDKIMKAIDNISDDLAQQAFHNSKFKKFVFMTQGHNRESAKALTKSVIGSFVEEIRNKYKEVLDEIDVKDIDRDRVDKYIEDLKLNFCKEGMSLSTLIKSVEKVQHSEDPKPTIFNRIV